MGIHSLSASVFTASLRLLLVGYIQVLARAVGTLLAGAVSPVTLAGVGAAYAALVLASVYVTELELRLPLVHYKTPYVQVRRLIRPEI